MAARLLGFGALVLVAGACGAEAIPPDDVAAAGESTKAVGSARSETVTRFSAGDGSESHEFRSTATVDYANDRSTYVDAATGCRTITIGDVFYSEVPRGEAMPDGKRWVGHRGEAVDGERLFEQSQEQTTSTDGITTWSTIVGFSTAEPAPDDYLDYLRESSGEPERVGDEDIRGVPTTHYRTTLDRRSQMRAELEAGGWKAANIERYLETMLETEEEIEVWVDADGLVRRLVTSSVSNAETGMAFRSVITTEYFDFGVAVEIEPPPVAELIDSDEWQRLTDQRMREQLDEYRGELEEGIAPLPGAFEPSTSPSCLH